MDALVLFSLSFLLALMPPMPKATMVYTPLLALTASWKPYRDTTVARRVEPNLVPPLSWPLFSFSYYNDLLIVSHLS